MLVGQLLQVLQNAAGFDGEGQIVLVDMAHGVQAREAEHDLLAAVVGGGAYGKPGIAALGHDLYAGCSACLDHACHFGRVAGTHHGQGLAVHALAPVLFVGAEVAVGQHMGGAHNLAQGFKQSGGSHGKQAAAGAAERGDRRKS